jgi:hypothetical protein
MPIVKLILGFTLLTGTCGYAQDQTAATVKFEDITITFKGMAADPQAAADSPDDGNTKSFNAWTGYQLTPGLIHIQSDHLSHVVITECFENSITLMNDGQHCDLTDWKHYRSPWKKLAVLKTGDYQGISLPYHDPKTQQFPPVTKDELTQQVEKHCGVEWIPLLNNYKSVFTEPCAVAVSKVFLRIDARDKASGKAVSRNIIIQVPIGD